MGKLKDETGNTYGYLTVIERAPNNADGRAMWRCKCKCGNEVVVIGKHLRSGNTKSCGCYQKERVREINQEKHKDMIGKTYGHLTVLDFGDYAKKPDGRSDQMMKCRCNLCGTITQIRVSDLTLGKQISCGCINSVGNTTINLYLTNSQCEFAREYRIAECRDVKPLPFDFAFFKDSQLIALLEYQGIQHFTCTQHGWDNPDKFEKVQLHDKIKFDYCQKNNIKLYYITYKDNIEQKLKEILDELYGK